MLKNSITPEMHYDGWARVYDGDVAGWDYHAPDRLFEKLQSLTSGGAGVSRILDVGIGTGLLSQKFRNTGRNKHIAGIDISREMLKRCAEKGIVNDLKRLDVAVDPFPFSDDEFDVTAAAGLMESIGNMAHALREMARVTKPGGLIAFTYVPTIRLQEQTSLKLRPGRTEEGRFVMGALTLHRHNRALTKTYAAGVGIEPVAEEQFTGYRTYVLMSVKYNLFVGRKQ